MQRWRPRLRLRPVELVDALPWTSRVVLGTLPWTGRMVLGALGCLLDCVVVVGASRSWEMVVGNG
jgi:hypothetical protein